MQHTRIKLYSIITVTVFAKGSSGQWPKTHLYYSYYYSRNGVRWIPCRVVNTKKIGLRFCFSHFFQSDVENFLHNNGVIFALFRRRQNAAKWCFLAKEPRIKKMSRYNLYNLCNLTIIHDISSIIFIYSYASSLDWRVTDNPHTTNPERHTPISTWRKTLKCSRYTYGYTPI